jgi:hypothetical protein
MRKEGAVGAELSQKRHQKRLDAGRGQNPEHARPEPKTDKVVLAIPVQDRGNQAKAITAAK